MLEENGTTLKKESRLVQDNGKCALYTSAFKGMTENVGIENGDEVFISSGRYSVPLLNHQQLTSVRSNNIPQSVTA